MKNTNVIWRAAAASNAIVLAGALAVTGVTGSAVADPTSGPGLDMEGVRELAQNRDPIAFAIPEQDLNGALLKFANTADVKVFYDASKLAGLRSPGVDGTMSPNDALIRLLTGTGVSYVFESDNTVRLMLPGDGSAVLGPITVEGRATPRQAQIGNLPEPYAGGQVARGGSVGVLGNKDMMDTPFSQMSYTSKLIDNQQATYVDDVLRNDPSVHVSQPASSGFLNYAIRGFDANASNILFDGLPGLSLFNLESTGSLEAAERVEVIRGPNGLLNGAASTASGSSTGGAVNLVPKRADDAPLTRLTGTFISSSQADGHADIGRRFGKKDEFGVRANIAKRGGDLPIDHSSRESGTAALALDYRGSDVRVAVDMGYQEMFSQGARRQLSIANGVTEVPDAPDNKNNWNAPSEFNDVKGTYGALHGEYDFTENITAFAKFGAAETRRQSAFANRQINSNAGTIAAGNETLFTRKMENLSSIAGARANLQTGPVSHQAVAAVSWEMDTSYRALTTSAFQASSIYDPVFGTTPAARVPSLGDTVKNADTEMTSAVIGDTLSFLDDRLQVIGGLRYQRIDTTNYSTTTGAATSIYDETAVTPMAGIVVKPNETVSLYASYIEGLEQGGFADTGTANQGEAFAPFRAESYEAGVKVDFGRIAASLALFQIAQPTKITDPTTNVQTVDGEQRHRGVELSVFGEVTDSVRLLSGVSFVDAKLTETAGGVNQGNEATVPELQARLGGEWDAPFLKGLTFTGLLSYVSSQYVNTANTLDIPSWYEVDFGVRYTFDLSSGQPVTIRGNVTNALDADNWAGTRFGGVVARDPRTFTLSVSSDF